MSASRLPPPPKGKPLPPDPVDKAPELPPPLPSRPARSGRLPSPPSRSNASEDLDGECYEEPDVPVRGKPPHLPPPPARPESGEIYDELDGQDDSRNSQSSVEPEQENYDACSFEQTQIEEPQDIYEETEEVECPEPIQEDTYEFVPEPPKEPSPAPPPPPPGGPPGPPVLPNRPPPAKAKAPPPIENSPELPKRPPPTSPLSKLSKILPGDGPKSAAISLDELGKSKNRLRKVSSEEKKDVPIPTPDKNSQAEKDTGSVLDRIRKFQGAKPLGPVSSKSLGPPPPPPIPTLLTSQAPPEIKPPAPVVENTPVKPPVQNNIITTNNSNNNTTTNNNNNNNNNNIPQYDDDQDIYDEGISFVDPLQGKEWFHGDLDRKSSKQKLHSIGEDGTFLVRKATKFSEEQPYTLVVLYQGHEYNLKVRRRPDKKIALGDPKEDEMAFKDVASLVEHHQKNDVILVNRQLDQQHQTILKKFPISIRR